MKSLLKLISPRRAVIDFKEQWDRPNPHRWRILAVACAVTFSVIYIAIPETQYGAPEAPDVIYYDGFEPGRSDEEIALENLRNQCEQDRLAADEAARAERRRELYRALGRATGLDVDEMEREIAAERAAEEDAGTPAAEPEYDCSQFEDEETAAG